MTATDDVEYVDFDEIAGDVADLLKVVGYGTDHTGAMLALVPVDAQGLAVDVADADPPSELHVTLGYIGESVLTIDAEEAARAAMRAAAGAAPGPVTATVTSIGELGDEGAVVLFLEPTAELTAIHDAVWAVLDRSGVEFPENFSPWKPHLTLGYAPTDAGRAALVAAGAPMVGSTIRFDQVALVTSGAWSHEALGRPGLASATHRAGLYAEFANPNHDERGRFARKGEGRAVPTEGIDDDGIDLLRPMLDPVRIDFVDGSYMNRGAVGVPGPDWSGVPVPEPRDQWSYVDSRGRKTDFDVYRTTRRSYAEWDPTRDRNTAAIVKACIDAKSDLVDRLGMDPVGMTFGHPAAAGGHAATNARHPDAIHIGDWGAFILPERRAATKRATQTHFMPVMSDPDLSLELVVVAHELGHIRHNRARLADPTLNARVKAALSGEGLSGIYYDSDGVWDPRGIGEDGFSGYAYESLSEAIAETHAQLVLGGALDRGPRRLAEALRWGQ